MLDSFRKREAKSNGYPRPQTSPYSALQEALSPARPESTPTTETTTEEHTVSATTTTAPAASTDGNVSKLIVGPDIKLKGAEITDCDTLVVEGRVEASMDSRVIQIAEHGVFVGKVQIDVAEIRGRFEGELVARKQLVIHSTGHVSGKIRYGKITVAEGGELLGDVAGLGVQAPAAVSNASNDSSEFGKNETSQAIGALFKAANAQR
jgi:cytoskeletal protein CcmA (bactofilin family)